MSERSQLGQVPIPGGNPVGEPLSGDDQFDALRSEIARDPVLGVPIDWKVVSDLAQILLGERSKDFSVACYLAVALAQTEGLVGLRDGLQIVVDLIENFWETAYPPVPKRLRGRVNSLGFLSEKSAPVLEKIEPKLSDADCLGECDRLLESIEKHASERCEGHEVPLGDLVRAMRELTSRLPQPGEPEPGPQALASGNAAGGSGGNGIFSPGEINSRSDVESLLLRASTFLKANDPKDPLGYRLPRILDFGELDREPPDDDGQLIVPPPEPSDYSAMKNLWAASDWLGLAEAADNVCRANPLCLDAHRYCSEGLAALGGPYKVASDGIRDEVRSLLRRAPRLVRLNFSDGTPLADDQTREWLQDEATSPPPSSEVVSEVDSAELEEARTKAKELARKGELPAALALLNGLLAASEASPRGRFLARLELAELCVSTGHDRVALPILGQLDDALERFGLEAWEPLLSRRVLELYYQCQKRGVADDGEAKEVLARAEKLYDRLCRVDPIAAAALD